MNDMNTGTAAGPAADFSRAAPRRWRRRTGCDRLAALAEIPIEYDGSKFQLAAPEPNPKHGGVLRVGILNRLPHFDFHQSGTVGSLGAQGCMFDNLIRHDPRDSGKTIIPDLAHSWEISKDGKTYTFFLRKGVQFHDGAELTADDVKATFDRIAQAAAGRQHPAQHPVQVGQRDHRTATSIPCSSNCPRRVPPSFIMAAIASGWNGIVRKQTLEDNNYNLRKVVEHSRHRPIQDRATGRERSLGDGEEQGLLEQGPAVSRRHRVLQPDPVLARTRCGDPVQPGGLCAHRRSGDRAQGEGHARHVHHRVQPERDPGNLDQQQEEAVRRSAGAPRVPSGAGSACAGGRDEGRGADAGRRLHLSVLGVRHADRRSCSSGSATRRIRPRRSRRPRR